jgi:chorismate-pyruvate lyase
MNISEQLTRLLKNGIANISIGMNPQGQPFVQAEQIISTGGLEGSMTKIMIQTVRPTIGECLNAASEQIEHFSKIHKAPEKPSNLVVAPDFKS